MKYKKIGGSLLSAYAEMLEEGPTALVPRARLLGMAPVLKTQKPPRAIVFLSCERDADLTGLATDGVRINAARGRVRTALVPLAKIPELAASEKIIRMDGSRRLRPRLDKAIAKVKLPAYKKRTGLTGRGVVIGIVDTGIDPHHPDFAGRILRIWDQTLDGPGVAEGSYGLELSDGTIAASRDTDGHGTHVAGIAAGAGKKYSGVAPQAELVVVKTSFQDAHIADAIRYIFRVADELQRPAVINLSLGGHEDPHDGTDPLSMIIDDESGPGRIVCVAAGNEGTDNIHARIALGAPATHKLKFFVPGEEVGSAALNGWYPGTAKLEIAITSPSRQSTPFQPLHASGNFERRYTLGDARVILQTPGKDPNNGDHHFHAEITPKRGASKIPSGTWELRVHQATPMSGSLDVWSLDDQAAPVVVFRGSHIMDSHKVGSPGTAASAITVGAYVTRVAWRDVDGTEQGVDMELHAMADFSSEGPLRNASLKPDLAAPGAMLVSALSADSGPERWTLVDSHHYAEGGTSMAAPFIAGVVALLLEKHPQWTPDKLKHVLKASSRIPRVAANTFDLKWGYGLFDASDL